MTRPLRIEFEGAWYHVMNRGAGRRKIFRTVGDRALFLRLLGDASAIFGVEVHAYCLLDNHYHLLLHTPLGGLGRAMRHLAGVYTQRFNRRHGTDGPLFRGRYRAILVDRDAYLLRLGRYIHFNPVAAGAAAHPREWRWSSYRAYVGAARPPAWLVCAPTLEMLGGGHRHHRYRDFVADGVDEELAEFFGTARLAPVLGGAGFRKRVLGRRLRGTSDPEIPATRRLRGRPRLEQILAATAAAFATENAALLRPRRGRHSENPARVVAMTLARRLGGYRLTEIAAAFGVGHYSSISVAARRLERRLEHDRRLAAKVETIRNLLRAGGPANVTP